MGQWTVNYAPFCSWKDNSVLENVNYTIVYLAVQRPGKLDFVCISFQIRGRQPTECQAKSSGPQPLYKL